MEVMEVMEVSYIQERWQALTTKVWYHQAPFEADIHFKHNGYFVCKDLLLPKDGRETPISKRGFAGAGNDSQLAKL